MSYTSCNLLLVKVYTAVNPVGGATSQSKEAARTKAADEAERKRIADEEFARTTAAEEAEKRYYFYILLF